MQSEAVASSTCNPKLFHVNGSSFQAAQCFSMHSGVVSMQSKAVFSLPAVQSFLYAASRFSKQPNVFSKHFCAVCKFLIGMALETH